MTNDAVVAAVEHLHTVPLDEWVAERTRLARELRRDGDGPGTELVAGLRKPTPPAWALNQVAREQPAELAAWLDAATALRDLGIRPDPAEGDALRAAMTAHRDATRKLVDVVAADARPSGRALSEPMLERVRALLQSATVDPERAEELRAGRIAEDGPQAG